MKKKKILISAYASEPNVGSEHEVGWQWIKNLNKLGHQIEVITRESNRKKILNEINRNKLKIKIHFYDLPDFWLKIFKKKSSNSYIYLILWQLCIFLKFKKYIESKKFDYIHHVSLVSLRYPSFLSLIKTNFIFGPVSGGEYVPIRFRKHFTLKEHIKELIRDLSNYYIKISPLMNLTFLKSNKIIVNNKLTKNLIPKFYHNKITILPSIGIEKKQIYKKPNHKKFKNIFKICFVGRPYGWKGIYLALDSIQKLSHINKNIKFTIISDLSLNKKVLKFIKFLNIQKITKIKKNMSKKKLYSFLKYQDLNLFPSFRDSGGFVVLESLINSTPSIVLDISGTSTYIKKNGIKIGTINKSFSNVSSIISSKMNELSTNKKYNSQIYKNLSSSIEKLYWKNKISKFYEKL